jgi:NADH-quinone oxidoreductase subunit F
MGQHRQILLEHIEHADEHTLVGYESRGGYSGMRKALGMDPLAVIEEVKKSGLRGRGGAGFPAGQKWSFVPRNSGKPVYIVCNADESEPGTFKDRLLLERTPHSIIEGMMVAAWAVQSNWMCVYIRGEYAYPYSRLKAAVDECYAKGYLGENIFGSGYTLHLTVHRGAGAYICGEETGLLESLEGKKGQPRLKPPYFPATMGLYYSPTVLNNVETYASVPWIMRNGGEAYSSIGTEKSKGTKLISASGHINKPGVYEIEMGYSFKRFIEEELGGIRNGRKLKAVIPGGSSMPILRAEEIEDATMDYECMNKLGTYLGSGGVIVMDDTVDMVDAILNLTHFYAHESCGQCTPCREGGHWVEKIFKRMAHGESLPGDLELIDSIVSQIAGHTICMLGDSIAMPVRSFTAKFKDEFKERIAANIAGKNVVSESLNASFGDHSG